MTQTLLADYATPLDPTDVQAEGYIAVLRYLAPPDTRYDWKRFTVHERDAIFTQSTLGILTVFESFAARALQGVQAGIDDANTANYAALNLGHPPDVPIFFACDTNATADQVRAYFHGVASVRTCSGVYGGINVVDPLLLDGTMRYGWQTCAWSNNKVSQRAHLYQRLKPTTSLRGSFDEDVLLRPLPMWTNQPSAPAPVPVGPPASPQPPAAPIHGGPGVYIFQVVDGAFKDAQIYDYGFGPVHISGPESKELTGGGVKVVPISGATYSARFAGVR